ncbi:MAG TPA: NAD(P)/FAD-dependent oxidoreductase, partial [bacterium]|nr:NAD(P)/FAD-dependent oxidoreductase [bacterium]
MASNSIVPLKYQPPLPMDRLILNEAPGDEALPMDVLIVGAGPAGLACAIKLKQLAQAAGTEVEVGVLEKAAELGGHCLSGAVINPRSLRELFPGMPDSDFPFRRPVASDAVYLLTSSGQVKLPTPPTMNNHGNFVASICEVVRWLGEQAEGLGVNLFPGYPADSLLVEGSRVLGVRTTPAGLERDGSTGGNFTPPTDVAAQVTVLAEGTRGTLTQGFLHWQQIPSPNPQIYALGVKEIWETRKAPGGVVHTMGWPLPTDAFGGSFLYPMADNLVAFGLVVGLDYHQAALDVHGLLQRLKQHPLFAQYLMDGTIVEWGAKTIPEGGLHSLPARFCGDGALVVGDAAGLVDVPSLKGIHYAVQSGIYAAEAIFEALQRGDTAGAVLG